MARVILNEAGEDVVVGGVVSVIGTSAGGEVITVVGGTIILDPSFNAGGDIVNLAGAASSFTIRMSGSAAILVGAGVTISIPVGTAGLVINFGDGSRTLAFDSALGVAKLGDQILTRLAENVAGALPVQPATITGTDLADTLNGTSGADVIDAGDGSDVVYGNLGDDRLNGGPGSDEISGGAGNDLIVDDAGQTVVVDGGTGNDEILVGNPEVTSVIVSGGDGDDIIDASLGTMGYCSIDAGSGADVVTIRSQGMGAEVYLGLGRDKLVLAEGVPGSADFGGVAVRDFETGATGDTIDLTNLLSVYLAGWDQSSDPFSTGHLRLFDDFGVITLQVDRDGEAGPDSFENLIFFDGVDIATFTKENFGGWDPEISVQAAVFAPSDAEATEGQEPQEFAVDGLALASVDFFNPMDWQSGYHFIA